MFVANDLSEPTETVTFWDDRLLAVPPPSNEHGPALHPDRGRAHILLPFSPRLDRSVTPARATALKLIPFVRTEIDGRLFATRALGALLNKEDPPGTYRLAEEAVNRTAQRLVRRFERARSADGRVHIWVANSRGPTQPQTPSGLRFDVLQVGPE